MAAYEQNYGNLGEPDDGERIVSLETTHWDTQH